MKILVLGSAAGGGFPQWNCNCDNCQLARAGSPIATPRTQSSLAVSVDGKRWLLLNASPDIRQQISENKQLHPANGKRDTPIAAVVLTNADVDHIAGLLTLRERQRFNLYATQRVLGVLQKNSVFNVLNPQFVNRLPFSLDTELTPKDAQGNDLQLKITPFSVPGKVALYMENENVGDNFGTVEEDTVGLCISSAAGDKSFFYLPGCAAIPSALRTRVRNAQLVLMDGTTWINDEMRHAGVGQKTSNRMGHMAIADSSGTLDAYADLGVKRKIFVHINNTNPVLLENSAERQQVQDAGWEVAFDGMEICL